MSQRLLMELGRFCWYIILLLIFVQSEEFKSKKIVECKKIEDECEFLKDKIEQLENEINQTTINDQKLREDENRRHEEFVEDYRKKNAVLKEEIKNRLSTSFK